VSTALNMPWLDLPHWMRRAHIINPRACNFGSLLPPGPIAAPSVAAGPADPLTIVTSVSPFLFLSADLGVTIGTGVSAWADQSGNGHDASQGTAASQPALVTGDVDFGGRNSILADGSNDFLDVTWNPPAPGTQPVWFFCAFNQITWGAAKFLFVGNTSASSLALAQAGATPAMVQQNTAAVNSNTGAGLGSPVRGQVYFSGSVSDYTKLGAVLVTGASAGVVDPIIFRLFSRNGGTQSINAKLACLGAWVGEPSAGEKAALDAWITAYYGAGVGV